MLTKELELNCSREKFRIYIKNNVLTEKFVGYEDRLLREIIESFPQTSLEEKTARF